MWCYFFSSMICKVDSMVVTDDTPTGSTIYPGSIIYAPREIGKLEGIQFTATLAPIVSSLALSLASLNSIK